MRERNVIKSYEPARSILGPDFISAEEIQTALGLEYGREQLAWLLTHAPPTRFLRWCRENRYALVAGPPRPMALEDICSTYKKCFGNKKSQRESSPLDRPISLAWLAIRKVRFPGSAGENWRNQKQFLSEKECVPTVTEVSWFASAFLLVRGSDFFNRETMRTSSLKMNGARFIVKFTRAGVVLDSVWDSAQIAGLGVAAARHFPVPAQKRSLR